MCVVDTRICKEYSTLNLNAYNLLMLNTNTYIIEFHNYSLVSLILLVGLLLAK